MAWIERPRYLDWLSAWRGKDVAKVLTGVRRCGKSTILRLFRQRLVANGIPPASVLDFNLEDPDTEAEFSQGLRLYQHVKALAAEGGQLYVFLDEAQHLAELERTVVGLGLLENVDLYLTGSYSAFLSAELGTRLTGRYVELRVLPLSFSEYATAHIGNTGPSDTWPRYLRDGGFPYVVRLSQEPAMAGQYLRDVMSAIVARDIAPRHPAFNATLFDSILLFMLDNIGNLSTINKISSTLTSLGRKTGRTAVETYVEALVDSFVLYKAPRYDIRGKLYLANSAKYYAVDLGLRRALRGSRNPDLGHSLENLVYLELLRLGDRVAVGRIDRSEVDFLANGAGGLTYIQVCQSVLDPAVLARELAPLRAIPDHHPRLLIVGDQLPPSSHDGITQMNVQDWLARP
ncbi:MAG: ATP-binding protein [Bifidobacteriaceae bacterium]|jgi:predicted AAA+ superfamily ATPase|nr:ATP-binding protein [Bifidobacteriaceae bacterium]